MESEGKSNIKVKGLNTDDFELSSDGEGEITIEGKVDYLNVTMDGEGKLLAKDLLSKNATINLYGDGKVEVNSRK
mgnify:CR=1 FL=1